ncbi:inositol monophosphatase family protein [Eilatimonas milleporae]|uniref:Inositol-1-monophosphatase n=1 Tax=Eilatimonas milleporae TaxID=911205 RepID=A0A3M0CLN5_9PROT|nr:inositol monophosphatase family protein [Eilatimonas milleporae]RMB07856.1 myo-inositol-1(or 4)-monophosphatase [Eilatimonas milleporae]
MAHRSALINVMVSAAMKASRGLRRDFGEVEHLQVSKKGPSDFVSVADRRAEKVLFEELHRARPDFGFLMEESGEVKGKRADVRFLIDPLDGTTNFLHSVPHFATTVAVEERGEIIAGVIYAPLTDELFWAERGVGAYLNDTRLRVSGRGKMDDALLATGIPFRGRDGHDAFRAELSEMMTSVAGVRRFGAATLDLAYVAAGRFDGFWESGLQPWDMAAGILLVREAGGYVTDMTGGQKMLERGDIIAANDRLHAPIERVIKRARRKLADA